jgi:hypothetical protein
MAADFPTGVKTFSTKVDGVDLVQSSHINDAQAEIVAIETELKKATGSTVNHAALTNLTTGDPHTQYLKTASKATGAEVVAGEDDAKFVTAKALADALVPGVWTNYTPTITYAGGTTNPTSVTATIRYIRVGKIVFFHCNGGSFTRGSGDRSYVIFTLPVNGSGGTATMSHQFTPNGQCIGYFGGNTISFIIGPMTAASGYFWFSGFYEVS